ncbi:MAG TPA: MFS transporter [Roseiflexaceae bacterium]|nr:MFS transporter [Roseiflexaceae bacterium]
MASEQASVAATATGSIWDREHAMLTIGLILTIIGPAFEALAVANTMPATVRDLGGIEYYGWAFSAFMLANMIGITIAGAEIDRLGPSRPFVIGMSLFGAGLLIAGLAPTMEIMIIGRAVQGFGAGFNSGVVYVVVARGFDGMGRAGVDRAGTGGCDRRFCWLALGVSRAVADDYSCGSADTAATSAAGRRRQQAA